MADTPTFDPTHRYWGNQEPQPLEPIVASMTEPDMATGKRKSATMKIYGPIDSYGAPYGISAGDFSKAIADIGEVDAIDLHIHSPGGSAFDGIAIKNQLAQHPAKVNVTVDGLAASAASMIAMAGDTITMAPSSQMMIHDASAVVIGQPADLLEAATMLDKLSDSYADSYATKAGGTTAEWRARMAPETWFTADEAVDAGLADKVDKPTPKTVQQPKTRFDLSVFAHAGRSHAPDPAMPAKASPQAPATEPVPPPAKGAVSMTESEIKASLGLPEDADSAAVQAKLDELKTAAAKATEPVEPPKATDDDTVKAVIAALEASGKSVVSNLVIEEMRDKAEKGASAYAKQQADVRDETITAAFKSGKISADRLEAWAKAWDADPEGTKSDLDSLEARFPVQPTSGYMGDDTHTQDTITDELAADAAAFIGVKELKA